MQFASKQKDKKRYINFLTPDYFLLHDSFTLTFTNTLQMFNSKLDLTLDDLFLWQITVFE